MASKACERVECCIRCHRDILEHGGGVQVEPGAFICWDCERPGENLCQIAEARLLREAALERAQSGR